jgi:hypothetical protein
MLLNGASTLRMLLPPARAVSASFGPILSAKCGKSAECPPLDGDRVLPLQGRSGMRSRVS